MDPTTGTFISMDSYSGSIYDPVSLHKYLYANANPVTYTDPTGYFSFSELMVAQEIQSVINTVQMSSGLFKVLRWVNAIVTVYDVFQQIKGLVEEGKSVDEIIAVMLKDGAIDLLLDGLCSTKIGFILKPVLFVFSLGVQANQLVWAWTEGTTMDKIMYTAQAIAMVFGLAQQCFTGDTLVWTENGAIAISEVAIGDKVYAYDAETGEAILAKVTDISVSETNELVHLTINGELIRTTVSHPFYTASGEWKAAGDLNVGDHVVTMSGEATVEAVAVEKLSEAVTVYNLTVEGEHNYYVAENGVLVHNSCGEAGSTNEGGSKADVTTGLGYDAGDTPVRIDGDWTENDMKQALLGHPPRGLGSPDIHHGGQMPGGALHEVLPGQHRNNSALHSNIYNQGVTPEMRMEDRQLHWWYRAREQGADELLPDWIYD